MKIAIPLANGRLSLHFGHCEQFALVKVEEATKKAGETELLSPPGYEPGVLPRWLHEQGANVIIAGGMGMRAQQLFAQNGITVVVGASVDTPDKIVSAYLDGALQTGDNICDH
ncbi:MAG: NifB/NifX family molybdenum-iron cluster-binding protein [Phycisphaerae bacterium]|nr:NifB/NifX family molybdenum-iron cluster-binding protein [Phycisphaerae bacterium]